MVCASVSGVRECKVVCASVSGVRECEWCARV